MEMIAGRETDAEVAEKVMGFRGVRWWSIHPAESWDGLTQDTYGKTWAHTVSSDIAARLGPKHLPMEVLRPDDRGDMPCPTGGRRLGVRSMEGPRRILIARQRPRPRERRPRNGLVQPRLHRP